MHCHLRDTACMYCWLNFRAPDEEMKAYFPWVWICMISSLYVTLKWTSSIKRKLLSLFFFASLPLKHPSLQIASCLSKLAAPSNTAGTDGPVQVPSATPGSHFMYLSRKASCSSGCWKVLMNIQCPPPGVVAQKLLSSLVANRPGTLKFLKFSSFC